MRDFRGKFISKAEIFLRIEWIRWIDEYIDDCEYMFPFESKSVTVHKQMCAVRGKEKMQAIGMQIPMDDEPNTAANID